MRSSTDLVTNPFGHVDSKIADVYDNIVELAKISAELRQISYYMEMLVSINNNMDQLKALGDNIEGLEFAEANLASLNTFMTSLNSTLTSYGTLSGNNAFSGFTQLGADDVAHKRKIITGNSGDVGNPVNVAHGIGQSKLIDFSVILLDSAGEYIKPSSNKYNVSITSTDVHVETVNLTCENRPFKVALTYSE